MQFSVQRSPSVVPNVTTACAGTVRALPRGWTPLRRALVIVGVASCALLGVAGRTAAGEKAEAAPAKAEAAPAKADAVPAETATPQQKGAAVTLDNGLAITPVSWSAEGKKAAEQLAAKLREAGIACDECEEGGYGFYDPKVMDRLPVPQAVMSCTGVDEEDITFDIFADAEQARKFVSIKQEYLCHQTHKYKMFYYPGFPYVAGENWLVEPDDPETASKVAKVLGGKAALADCSKLWPLWKRTPKSTATPEPKE